MSTPLTAYQIRVLVELHQWRVTMLEEPTAPQLADGCGWGVEGLRGTLRSLRAGGLVTGRWQRWSLTDAGRRAAVLAYSDELVR